MEGPVNLRIISSLVSDGIKGMLDRAKLLDGYLSRVVIPQYKEAQRQRFETKNSGSDFTGPQWPELNPSYSSYKQKKYSSYPGAGQKINIRTSRLLNAITLQANSYDEPTFEGKTNNSMLGIYGKKDNWKNRKLKGKRKIAAGSGREYSAIVSGGKLNIYVLVPYAQFVDDRRSISGWSNSFYERITSGAMDYLKGKGLGI